MGLGGEKDTASIFHIVCIFVGSSSIVGFFCLHLIWSVGWNTVYVGCFDSKDWALLRLLSGHRGQGWHPEFGGRFGAWEEYVEGGLTWQDPVLVVQSLAGKTGWNMSYEWPGGLYGWLMS